MTIFDYRLETQEDGDRRVLQYLEKNSFYNCIDIGGVHRPWAAKHVSAYVDLVTFEAWQKRYPDMYDEYPEVWRSKLFLGDCEDIDTWRQVQYDVAKNGKYDFVICTQAFEHFNRPTEMFKRLPGIANQGYIAVPNKYFELGRGREVGMDDLGNYHLKGHYRGALPHRWIFSIRDETVWCFPKLNVLDFIDLGAFEKKLFHFQPLDAGTLGFFWKYNIPRHVIDDTDIGFPNPKSAIDMYRRELKKGL